MNQKNEQPESTDEAIRRVAREIQDILVKNKMSMVPSISIGLNADIIVPDKTVSPLILPEDIEKQKKDSPLMQADFMQD